MTMKLWQIALGSLVVLMALGIILPGNFLQKAVDDLDLGSILKMEGDPVGDPSLPRIKVSMECLKSLELTTGVTCDSVQIFDSSFTRLGGDTSNDATTVEIPNCIQGKSVWVYVKDTTAYDSLVERTIPKPGGAPETTAYSMQELLVPVKMATADVTDYVLYSGTDIAAGNYNFTTSGATPVWDLQLVTTTPASCQDEVWGADFTDPVLQKHHSAYLIIRMSVAGNRVTSPGFTKISDMTYDYYFKTINPWECDYLPDSTYSQQTYSESVTFQFTDSASDAATVLVSWYDDVEDEEIFKINFPTAFDDATVTIQD